MRGVRSAPPDVEAAGGATAAVALDFGNLRIASALQRRGLLVVTGAAQAEHGRIALVVKHGQAARSRPCALVLCPAEVLELVVHARRVLEVGMRLGPRVDLV